MTATLAPPPPPATPTSRREAPSAPRRQARSRWTEPWVAEVLLLSVTLVVVAGLARLFADATTVGPLLVAAVTAHVAAAASRRRAWGVAATVAVAAGAFAAQVSVVLYPHTGAYGIPTPATLAAVGDDLRTAWHQFGQVEAPAPRERGFLLAASLLLWVAVGLADWAAFRLRTVAEAVLPTVAVFAFTTLLGRGRGAVPLTALLVAATLAFTAAQRAARSRREDAWVGGRDHASGLARSGALAALAVAVVSALLGPHLPTAGDEALLDLRDDGDRGGRTTISPLVDIKARLVEQSDEIVFRVRAERGTYWRAATLTVFDGELWSYAERFGGADGELSVELPEGPTEMLRQEFSIGELDAIYAPGAATPVDVVESSKELEWNPDLATLVVADDRDLIDGARYVLDSATPSFAAEDLDARLPEDLPDEVEEATAVPAGLPASVAETAATVVAGVDDTPYAQMRALQDWFRSEFTYDLDVGPGHDGTAIETFLDVRRGYCEQFAGTFAAMARTLGIPSRVAVGFTMGDPDPEAEGTGFVVRGTNAHAWPEVWIPEAGWVPFEPTPGRGLPGAELYTGVEPQQAGDPPQPSPASTTAPATPSSSLADPPPTSGSTPPPTSPPVVSTTAPSAPPDTPDPVRDDGGGAPSWLVASLLVALAGLVLLALDAATIAAVRARRARAASPDDTVAGRVRTAWTHALHALHLVDVAPAPAETAREFARRASGDLGDAGPALARLAGMVTVTTWAPSTPTAASDLGDQADALAQRISQQVHDVAGWRPRIRSALDPRTLRRDEAPAGAGAHSGRGGT